MTLKHCAGCGQAFQPRPQAPKQTFCSAPACQRSRKRQWQQSKLQSDPDYRGNQRQAQRAWHESHPDYWRHANSWRLTVGIWVRFAESAGTNALQSS